MYKISRIQKEKITMNSNPFYTGGIESNKENISTENSKKSNVGYDEKLKEMGMSDLVKPFDGAGYNDESRFSTLTES
eukprot:UN29166